MQLACTVVQLPIKKFKAVMKFCRHRNLVKKNLFYLIVKKKPLEIFQRLPKNWQEREEL